jgi:hypothetical protein
MKSFSITEEFSVFQRDTLYHNFILKKHTQDALEAPILFLRYPPRFETAEDSD